MRYSSDEIGYADDGHDDEYSAAHEASLEELVDEQLRKGEYSDDTDQFGVHWFRT